MRLICLDDLTAAAVATLEITADSLANFYPSMDANFPFDTPLVIQAFDADGYVITDGPDANLVSLEKLSISCFQCHITGSDRGGGPCKHMSIN